MAEAVQECATHQPTGGSGVPNLQQVTTIPYCINYNCTIENYGIGQLLDIVYTTDSFLVVIPKGNQTSMVITKHGDDLSFYCVSVLNSVLLPLIVSSVILLTAQLLMISYIIIVHMLIKELRTSFGVLLMFYNGGIVFQCVTTYLLTLSTFVVPTNSQPICYSILFAVMQGTMIIEELGVFILAHVAVVMYYSHNLRTDIPVKKLFKCYITYVLAMHALFSSFIFGYDAATGEYSYVIWGNGYYNTLFSMYDTQTIALISANVNKMLQVIFFTIFLVY